MQEVTIYSKPNCTQCTMAKNIMKSKGIQFTEVEFDVGQPQVPGKVYESVDAFKAEHPNVTSVPQFIVDGQHIGGFKEFRELIK